MIGFKKEYEKVLINSNYIYEKNNNSFSFVTDEEMGMVIQFLEESDMIFSKTLAVFDGENYIGPYMIFSDGEWIWPSYFLYYLAKQKRVNSDFLFHVRQKEYTITRLTDEQRNKATSFLEKEMLNIV